MRSSLVILGLDMPSVLRGLPMARSRVCLLWHVRWAIDVRLPRRYSSYGISCLGGAACNARCCRCVDYFCHGARNAACQGAGVAAGGGLQIVLPLNCSIYVPFWANSCRHLNAAKRSRVIRMPANRPQVAIGPIGPGVCANLSPQVTCLAKIGFSSWWLEPVFVNERRWEAS